MDDFYGKTIYKWMMTVGTPISGNPHIHCCFYSYKSEFLLVKSYQNPHFFKWNPHPAGDTFPVRKLPLSRRQVDEDKIRRNVHLQAAPRVDVFSVSIAGWEFSHKRAF